MIPERIIFVSRGITVVALATNIRHVGRILFTLNLARSTVRNSLDITFKLQANYSNSLQSAHSEYATPQ